MDFSEFVDTTKIFEFISEIREDSKLWTFEFDTAQDIVSVLKSQLSYLFKETLLLRRKFYQEVDELFNLNISNRAINLILEKPEHYEIRFFFQTMIDEILKKESIKNDYEYAIILNSKFAIYDNQDLINWIQQRLAVLSSLIDSLNNLIQKVFPIFYAEPGTPSNLKGLFYTAETYARIYESIIDWTIETASTFVNEECSNLRDRFAKLSDSAIKDVWNFPFETLNKINDSLNNSSTGDSEQELNIMLTIKIDEQALAEYNIEFEKFKQIVYDEKRNKNYP